MIRMLLLALLLLGATAAHAQTPSAPQPAAPLPAVPQPADVASAPAPADARRLLDVLKDDTKRAQFISTLEGMVKALPPAPASAPAAAAAAAAAAGPVVAPAAATAAAAPAATAGPAPAPPAAATAAAAHPAIAAPALITQAPPTGPAALPIPLAADSLGAQLLVGASNWLSNLYLQLADDTRAVTDFPLITRWLRHLATDEDTRNDLIDAAWKLAVVLGAGLIAEWLLRRAIRRPASALAEHAPAATLAEPGDPAADDTESPSQTDAIDDAEAAPDSGQDRHDRPRLKMKMTMLIVLHRLPFALGHFALELLPVLAVMAVGYALVGSTPLGTPSQTRFVILAVVNAYVLCRAVVQVVNFLVAPAISRLRLLPVTDDGADYILVWSRRIAVIGIFGYAIAEVALLFGLYRVAHDTLIKLVVLLVHLAFVVIVLQKRALIARFIRGRRDATGPLAIIRRWLARIWHIVAVFYLVAMWLVWAFDVQDGFEHLLRISLSTLVVGLAARYAVVAAHNALKRWISVDPVLGARYPGLEQRLGRYHPVARAVTTIAIDAVALVVLFEAWGIDSLSWFETGALGGRLVSGLINIGLTLVFALLIWEVSNAAVERRLSEVTTAGSTGRSARLLTLLPMLRTVLMIAILLIAGLIVLSEIGVNIAPLLAGAGVVGIAIGFGSQKLVQDIITGLFLLLENAMQVGDVVTLGGLSGTVEALSIRVIRLRALDGSIHIIPFSAVTTVTNSTRDYGYAVIDIGVGLSEDPDRISGIVRGIARELRAEPRWASAIRDDIEVLGIDRFVDLAYIIRVRLMTLPSQRWAVGRELNQRIKEKFDELAVDSPITSTKVLGTNPLITRVHKATETGSVAE
jgi:small-conductance mechanosensitive channel